jgi:SAM-dependent methyltransferase
MTPQQTGAATRCPICAGATLPESRFGAAPLLRCGVCGFSFLHGEVDPKLYGDIYFEAYSGGDYLTHEKRRRHESRVRLDLLAHVTPPPARLLEIGAAAGFFLDEAQRRGYFGVGIEPNTAMATHARDELGLDVRTGTLEEIELEPGSFDAACAFHVVEHLADPLGSLKTISEAVRPGGHVLVEVPNAESAAARRLGPAWQPLDLPYHVGHYGPGALRTLLDRAGLEVLLIDTIPFAVYGASSRAAVLALGIAEAGRARAVLPAGPHPSGHQLLRGVARRATT